jgi:hypothetical protein
MWPRYERWDGQGHNERQMMQAQVDKIRDATFQTLSEAYSYPSARLTRVIHSNAIGYTGSRDDIEIVAKLSCATVFDVKDWDKKLIGDVIQKSTTRSVLNVDLPPSEIDNILENNHHLFYLRFTNGQVCEVVEQNRARWFEQQKSDAWTFYFSPESISSSGYCSIYEGKIAHITLFINARTRVRLHLLHFRYGHPELPSDVVRIQARGKYKPPVILIHEREIPLEMESWHFELGSYDDGKHEWELLVKTSGGYHLEDIVVEFFHFEL